MQSPAPSPEAIEGAAPRTSYDEVPYSSFPYAQSHPNRLAVVGTLFGMTPAPVDCCRVLELGCASGGNLIPMAMAFPQASFVGIDLSSRQIAEGKQTVEALGLRNIELRSMSITDVDASMGKFDYIICHGVYSWVPEAVRQKIFEICAAQLNPQGIAYISYNTYPGWHMRGTVRDMMVFHVRRWTKPEDRVGHARALLDWLEKTVPPDDNAYSSLLRGESERLRSNADSYVLHEHLEAINEPLYFYQFAEAAAAKGLQFIAEAQSGARWLEGLGPEADQAVRQVARDIIEYEQYLDFLRNRMFRRSLLCHADVALDRRLAPKRVRKLWVASKAVPDGPVDVTTNEESKFRLPDGVLTTNSPLVKRAFSILAPRWPEAITIEDLIRDTLSQFSPPPERSEEWADNLSTNIIHSFIRCAMELYCAPPKARATPGEFPKTTDLARLQVKSHRHITTLLHEVIRVNDIGLKLIALTDGTRNRADLLSELLQAVQQGQLVVRDQQGQPLDTAPTESVLEPALDNCLNDLARLGLLCA
jgi:methyltransferase-like protein/2-polyprenyl-3-methyl-5-hydroxy-6-metoxy-1,4-benzoquinol methylase